MNMHALSGGLMAAPMSGRLQVIQSVCHHTVTKAPW